MPRLRWLLVAMCLSTIAGYTVSRLTAEEEEHERDGKGSGRGERGGGIGDMMERLHEGRRAPLKQLQKIVADDKPSWDDLSKLLPGFQKMADALKKARKQEVRDASDGYASAIDDLSAAVKNQDAAKAQAAVKALKASCGDCHYKGGPGGKLD
jgi:hypothetical protein